MNKVVSSSIAVLSAAIFVLSCAKEPNVIEPLIEPQTEVQEETGIKVTINTGKPEADALTKTEMYGGSPYWSVGDVIGVSDGSTSNTDFNTSIAERATTASFSGTVASAGEYYAYYPYTSNGVGEVNKKHGAKFDLPANQNPTATSYDGKADVLVSKSFTVTETTPTVNDLEFTRLGAVVKLVLIDAESTMTTSQHPSTVSMTAESALAGRVLINMQEQCLEDPYYNSSNTVTANYTSLTKYEIDGTNATYLIVVPQTLAAGSTLTISASTEGYSIEKNITIPSGGIALEAGKITTLNISLTPSHITASSGLVLPFNDDFSWQNTTKTDGLNFSSTPAIPSAKYSAFDWIYGGGESGAIRMSKSGGTGYLTTVALNLSSAFYVHIKSKYWSDSDATHLLVSVDDGSPKDITLTGSYADYYVNFGAATNKSKVKVTTNTNKRAYFKAFDVISGAHVFPPVINVTSSNPMAVANTSSSQTITYSIDNPTSAVISAVANVSWIHDFDCSTAGEVSFEVDAQVTDAAARSGVITLSYTEADNVTVTVNQAAGPSSGGGVTWTRVTTVDQITSGGTFIIGYEKTAKSGEIVPMRQEGTATVGGNGFIRSGDSAGNTNGNTLTMTTTMSASSTAAYETVIEAGPTAGTIAIKIGSNYIKDACSYGSKWSNNVTLSTTKVDDTGFTPTIGNDDVVTFTSTRTVNSAHPVFQYNTSNPRFCSYGNAAQKNLVLYKKN